MQEEANPKKGADMLRKVVPLVAALAAAAPAMAQVQSPFGIAEGVPVASLPTTRCFSDGTCQLQTVPTPHPLLSAYSAKASPQTGVCQVSGYLPVTSVVATVDTAVATIRSQLTEVYGQPRYLTGMADPTRREAWLWTGSGDVAVVTLIRIASNNRQGIELDFQFGNYDQCQVVAMPNPFR